jgi:hypothetical protein
VDSDTGASGQETAPLRLAHGVLNNWLMKRTMVRIRAGSAATRQPLLRRRGGGTLRVGGRGSTLLALVQEVQRRYRNDADVVRAIRRMVNSGAVVLTGSFAGARFR